ncbi:MAG: hypothetical protein PHP62_05675 [Candidatus Moranbacteria bacterium]|nr:hypothetical protein [Candidatus Moranbacteria bacterium]
MKKNEEVTAKKSDGGLPQKNVEVGAEATFPYNERQWGERQRLERESGPREFSEFDPQTW